MFLIRVFQNERFNRFLRFFASLINNGGTFTAREHVMGKSETLNILSCERGFIAVENWMARCHYEIKTHENPVKFFMVNLHVFHRFFMRF